MYDAQRAPVLPNELLNMDPPEHTRLRHVLTPELTGKRIRALEPMIRARVGELIDAMEARGPAADLMADFALPLPLGVICALLGVPDPDQGEFHRWSRTTLDLGLPMEERATIDLIKNGDLGKLVQGNIEALTMTEAFGGLFTALADPLLAKSVRYAGFDLVMDIGRRFSRTMNTLWDGLDGGNWDPSGNALISLVKLRLVHAAARRTGLAHGWNQARDGMPISQRLEAEELMYVGASNVQLAAKFGFHMLDWLDRKVFPGAGAVGASLVRMMDAHVADVLDIRPNPALDIPVATLGPHLYRPVYEIQQKFPLLVPVHEKMFRIASKTVAWYAVDFRDYDLQMPVH